MAAREREAHDAEARDALCGAVRRSSPRPRRHRRPGGGVARKIRPTALGLQRLRADRESLREGLRIVVQDWPAERVRLLGELLLEFNLAVEELEGTPWPRQ